MLIPDNTRHKKIQYAIKNHRDISDLIVGYDLSGMNLDNSIISKWDITGQTMSGISMAYCTLGTDQGGIVWNNATLKECCFDDSRFPGLVQANCGSFISCSFKGAFLPYANYRRSVFSKCVFCDTVFRVGARSSLGAQFDDHFFGPLTEHMGIKILKNDEYKRLKQLEELYGQSLLRNKT